MAFRIFVEIIQHAKKGCSSSDKENAVLLVYKSDMKIKIYIKYIILVIHHRWYQDNRVFL